jgi:exportin-2 (importin alpha re-exporter)
MFGDATNLQMLCEKIIIPNMFFRDSDEENFEDNAREYIRRDIEGSDSDTRRRAATELVKGLRKHFEQPVTHTCASYITSLLNAAQQDWKAKDVAIYLVIGLTVTTQTAAGGVVTTNAFVPILEFFRANIAPEFVKPNALAVLQADALKFTTTFRNQIPKEDIKQVLPSIIQLLASPSYVVSTYVANFLERLLVVRDKDANGVFNSR